jgi:tetratricopeptide (TPR) repeat protein
MVDQIRHFKGLPNKVVLLVQPIANATLVVTIAVALIHLTDRRNRDYWSPIDLWKKTAAQRPGNIRAHMEVAGIYFNLHMGELAKMHCQQVVGLAEQQVPHFNARMWRAKAYYYTDNDQEAGRILDQLLAQNPNNPHVLNLKGLLAYKQHNDQEAADLFAKAAAIVPSQAEFYYNGALPLIRLDRHHDAQQMLERVLHLSPNNYMAWHQLGLAFVNQNRVSDAVSAWQKGLAINPDYVPSLTALAWVLSVDDDPSRRDGVAALRFAQHLVPLKTNPTRDMLEAAAAAFAENGQYDQAVKLTEQAKLLSEKTDSSVIPGDALEHRLAAYRAGKPWRMNFAHRD